VGAGTAALAGAAGRVPPRPAAREPAAQAEAARAVVLLEGQDHRRLTTHIAQRLMKLFNQYPC
jgi:hypothetical protein